MAKLKEGEIYAIPNSDMYITVYSCDRQKDGQYKIIALTVDPDTLETTGQFVSTTTKEELAKYKKVKI